MHIMNCTYIFHRAENTNMAHSTIRLVDEQGALDSLPTWSAV